MFSYSGGNKFSRGTFYYLLNVRAASNVLLLLAGREFYRCNALNISFGKDLLVLLFFGWSTARSKAARRKDTRFPLPSWQSPGSTMNGKPPSTWGINSTRDFRRTKRKNGSWLNKKLIKTC